MQVTIENTDANLLADIGDDLTGWTVEDFPVIKADGYLDGNRRWQVVYNADAGRAGLVFRGSGSSGHTEWTDAISAEDAHQRMIDGRLSP